MNINKQETKVASIKLQNAVAIEKKKWSLEKKMHQYHAKQLIIKYSNAMKRINTAFIIHD